MKYVDNADETGIFKGIATISLVIMHDNNTGGKNQRIAHV
jgi:hypothetical protein